MSGISADYIGPKTGLSVTIDKVVTHSALFSHPTINQALIDASTVTGSVLVGGTLSGVSNFVSSATYHCIHKNATATMMIYCTLQSPIAFISLQGFTGTGAGAFLTITETLPINMRPAVNFSAPIHLTLGGVVKWGYVSVTTAGVMTLGSTAGSNPIFTDSAAFTIDPIEASWCVV